MLPWPRLGLALSSHWPRLGLVLASHLRLCINISPALGHRQHDTLTHYWFNVGPLFATWWIDVCQSSKTLAQPTINIDYLFRMYFVTYIIQQYYDSQYTWYMYRCRPISHQTILTGSHNVRLNIPRMSGQVGHEIWHFRCNDVVKPLSGPPHPLLNMLKEAVNFIYSLAWPCVLECPGHHICFGQKKNQVKFMNISTEHILQCNQSDPLADAGGKRVDLMNENGLVWLIHKRYSHDPNVIHTLRPMCGRLLNSTNWYLNTA